ncbi:MAG: FliM/FliN family flagellar motor switch protein [Myxococcales bacterium]|nr:FliM/FliN family flagellar motor switch protein [Myxococcales bacterium]
MSASPFPFTALPRYRRADAVALGAALRWLAPRLVPDRLAALGLAVTLGREVAVVGPRALDSSAAFVWLVREGARVLVSLSGLEIRTLARRLLALPLEIDAPRPLTGAEQAVAALAVAGALAQVDAAAHVEPWQPFPDLRAALARTERLVAGWSSLTVPLTLDGRVTELCAWIPPSLPLSRPLAGWRRGFFPAVTLEVPVVVATAPLLRSDLPRLAARDIVVVEPRSSGAELRIARGAIALRVAAGDSQAVVESGYVRRVMDPLPDDLEVELTVALGTLPLTLRQISELTVGQVVSLGRPLQGPFELRVGSRVIGSGELVEVEGALGVRVLSLASP